MRSVVLAVLACAGCDKLFSLGYVTPADAAVDGSVCAPLPGATPHDEDGDRFDDSCDNCPGIANSDQMMSARDRGARLEPQRRHGVRGDPHDGDGQLTEIASSHVAPGADYVLRLLLNNGTLLCSLAGSGDTAVASVVLGMTPVIPTTGSVGLYTQGVTAHYQYLVVYQPAP